MITVEDALALVFALVTPLPTETVPLATARGRVMPTPAFAKRDQPPFAASAMDGYAINGDAVPGATFKVIGEAGAGHAFAGTIPPGHAIRIFTGAPVPEATTRVVIQEDVDADGSTITLRANLDTGTNIRPKGQDFRVGDSLSPRQLRPNDIALLASMNIAEVAVTSRPVVAIIATGDELVMPGETPRPDQIIASNSFALKAMVEETGGVARMLPIARDTEAALRIVLEMALDADLIVTIGGASVGDHDLVGKVAADMGMERAFYKIAMRPGKPLMAGRLQGVPMLGLPGNPVSAIVCGHLFLLPMLRAMLGLGAQGPQPLTARLAIDTPAAGPRAHYMRARLTPKGLITPFDRQDSALLTVLTEANALLIRPIADPARKAGEDVPYLPI
jgi:molybdopterin molybdotransferase